MGYVVNKLTYQIQDTFDGLCCQPTGNVLNNTTGNVPLALLATLPYVVLQVQNHLRKNYAFVSVPGTYQVVPGVYVCVCEPASQKGERSAHVPKVRRS
jgi:hypothetical protein